MYSVQSYWLGRRPWACVRWWVLFGVVWLAGGGPTPVRGGIPEPDLVWYGRVMGVSGGNPVRLTAGTLVWHVEPALGGPALVLSTTLTNINDQFSYVLRVPCETPEPGGGVSEGVVVLSNPAVTYSRVTVTLDGQPISLSGPTGQFAPGFADRGRIERIDLQASGALPDSDGDGLPDAWEQQYFGSPTGANATDDSDGDGATNLEEFHAGTNPQDEQSRFAVVNIEMMETGILVEWSSETGRRYRVKRAASLFVGPEAYETLVGGVEGTPPLNQFLDVSASAGNLYFYLIQLEE
ncbi:MAG: hypothetical protein KJ072_09310 [Verrucomicrobia bacterium]|nr:hypothetical protein [Verrucomicrobiota bacterium]